jgi:NAD(P)-dependent dehydrogenase (short-subunit alcohol dehydrogenase family)
MGLFTNLQLKWFPQPLAKLGSFRGQKVLVVGGTTGLGLASAVHFVDLGASEVIITTRSTSRGEAAKTKLESIARGKEECPCIHVMELDMDRFESVVAFVEQLKRQYSDDGGLDYIILSAGIHNASFGLSPEGW